MAIDEIYVIFWTEAEFKMTRRSESLKYESRSCIRDMHGLLRPGFYTVLNRCPHYRFYQIDLGGGARPTGPGFVDAAAQVVRLSYIRQHDAPPPGTRCLTTSHTHKRR